jgi:3'-phosphoadenosine 5'-phosphosulfate sulfotransferase (PAPS reductase)/FAD synthetase
VSQLALQMPGAEPRAEADPDLASYDFFIVAFSGGKDSLACLLHLLDQGVPRDRIELWHHDVDGREGRGMMDWPCTPDYCRKVAAAFGLPIYFSWKVGGFEGEMDRRDRPTAPTRFETPDGLRQVGGAGKPGTRGLFPQVSKDLTTRWCSAYLKIDPSAAAIRNQERFLRRRVLVLSGERAEEPGRGHYKAFEPDRSDLRDGATPRHVDRWRPVHKWSEAQVWAIAERYRVNPHPCYRCGFGRCSCACCIFGNANQWASVRKALPERFEYVALKEEATGKTIKRDGYSLRQLADLGTPYEMSEADLAAARSESFDEPVILPPGAWKLPSGAFGDSSGPT